MRRPEIAVTAALTLALVIQTAPASAHEPTPPIVVKEVRPAYTAEARQAGIEGRVVVEADVDERGKVTEVRLVEGLGHGLDEAALAAMRRFRFRAARDEARRPAPSTFRQEFTFVRATADALDQVEVVAEAVLNAASSTEVRDRDFLLRPRTRPADVLEVTPGLFVVQHAGGGKSNQYFMRGFDLDHGTDLALFVDGVPVNIVSHAHGQGYADLHSLIPETVERIEVFKGPYYAQWGDLATAGAVNLRTRETAPHSAIVGQYGSFDTFRALLQVAPPRLGAAVPYLAAEVYGSDGPFDHAEGLRRVNVFGKVSADPSDSVHLFVAGSGYGGDWNASGQIPRRAVEAGTLSRWGSVDPTEGGSSDREQLWAGLRAFPDASSQFQALAYGVHYRLDLYSNFTFFAEDPENGDQIEQWDDRFFGGFRASYQKLASAGPVDFDLQIGADGRFDRARTQLHRTVARERLSTSVDADVIESALGLWVQGEVAPARWLRVVGGARVDRFGFTVDDHLSPAGSGTEGALLVSPKATVVVTPRRGVHLFANFGRGFHSNDARGVVRDEDPVTPLTPGTGAEVGARVDLGGRVDVALSGWWLDMDEETVWVGDAGTSELKDASRRFGVEGEVRAQILPWLFADLDVTATRARYVSGELSGKPVALAAPFTLAAGLSASLPFGLHGALRVRHLADRPADEDETLIAEGWTVASLEVGFTHPRFEIALDIQNLFDAEWAEVQFANASRLAGESSAAYDIHFTPGAPFSLYGSVGVRF